MQWPSFAFDGRVRSVLHAKVWTILGRLSFAIYLTHPLMISITLGDIYDRIPISFIAFGLFVVNFWLLAYGFAFMFHLLLEAPLTNLTGLGYQTLTKNRSQLILKNDKLK